MDLELMIETELSKMPKPATEASERRRRGVFGKVCFVVEVRGRAVQHAKMLACVNQWVASTGAAALSSHTE